MVAIVEVDTAILCFAVLDYLHRKSSKDSAGQAAELIVSWIAEETAEVAEVLLLSLV